MRGFLRIRVLFAGLLLLSGTLPAASTIQLKNRLLRPPQDIEAHRVGPVLRRKAVQGAEPFAHRRSVGRFDRSSIRRGGRPQTRPDPSCVVIASDPVRGKQSRSRRPMIAGLLRRRES